MKPAVRQTAVAVGVLKGALPLLGRCVLGRRALSSGGDSYDVAVVGGGPGGYVAAIKAAQLGLKTVCIEKRGTLGGTCLNIGCIPSKALLNISHKFEEANVEFPTIGVSCAKPSIHLTKMHAQKDKAVKGLTSGIEMLFKKNSVNYIKGTASLKGPNIIQVTPSGGSKDPVEVSAKNIILATGSESSPMPGDVIQVDENIVVTSTGALALKSIPQRMVVVGGGAIGLELGSVWRRFGTSVDVIEFMDSITPGLDGEMRKALQKSLEKKGFKFHLSSKVTGADIGKHSARVHYENAKGKHNIETDVVLLSVGRRPVTKELNLEGLGIQLDKGGRVVVDDHFRVPSHPSIFAIGDIIRGPMLAHKAEDEGIAVASYLAGQTKTPHVNYDAIPSIVYTHPELAGVGKTEEELKKAQVKYSKAVFPFAANSRARTNDDFEGSVKVLIDPSTKKILGGWIFGPSAGELISELTLAIEHGLTAEDISRTCHAHPTLSEAVREACMAASHGKPIHMP